MNWSYKRILFMLFLIAIVIAVDSFCSLATSRAKNPVFKKDIDRGDTPFSGTWQETFDQSEHC